jgi:hypothetical protein
MRTCHRGEPERLGNPASRAIRNRRADEFRPTRREFSTTPGAKFRQFRPTATHEPKSHKRLARARWGQTLRISLHEKKKKISVVQKSRAIPKPRERMKECT